MKKLLTKTLIALMTAVILMSTVLSGAVCVRAEETGIATEHVSAVMVPHDRPEDPEMEMYRHKDGGIIKKVGDLIIEVGKNFVPFGDTIVNHFSGRDAGKDGADVAKTLIDLAGDAIATAVPIAEPVVTVVKDVANRIINWFRK